MTVTTLAKLRHCGSGIGVDGAVYTAVACPFASVTMLLPDSVPQPSNTPATCNWRPIGKPACGPPDAFCAVTRIADCDPPSAVRLSGVVVIVSDSAGPDGPTGDGAVVCDTPHPAVASSES